jgi:hypothetical protein
MAYSPSNGSSSAVVSTPPLDAGSVSVAAANGLIYVLGGASGEVFAYNLITNTWAARQPAPRNGSPLATLGSDGLVYASWGPSLFAYDPDADAWTERAQPPAGHLSNQALVTGPDGLLYLVGTNDVSTYDPSTDSWAVAAPLPGPARKGSAVTVGPVGGIFVVGGEECYPNHGCWPAASMLVYDPGVIPPPMVLPPMPSTDGFTAPPAGNGFRHVLVQTDDAWGTRFYAIEQTGDLRRFTDEMGDGTNAPDGSSGWSVERRSCGFSQYTHVFVAGRGSGQVIYAVTTSGDLYWFPYLPLQWDECGESASQGVKIGNGWNSFTTVVGDWEGNIYGVAPDGALRWYRHSGPNLAEMTWAPGSGSQVGCGWQYFRQVAISGDGVIYGLTSTGRLLYYRDLRRDGTNGPCGQQGWDSRSGAVLACGLDPDAQLLPDSRREIYLVNGDGTLHWYAYDLAANGAGTCASPYATWRSRSGSQIWYGWDVR